MKMGTKKGITIGKTRTALYKTARILGDVNSVARGTVPQRLASRALGRLFNQLISNIIRGIFSGRR